jgi:hypothetical protein
LRQRELLKTEKLKWFFCFVFAAFLFAGCEVPENVDPKSVVEAQKTVSKSFTDNGNGTISFSYNNTNKEKCKVVTQLEGGKMYQYDIPSGQCDIVFPLSQGNGTYRLYLCKNTSGNKYSVIESTSVTLNIDDELSPFLCSNYIIDWNAENEAIKKAGELTAGMEKPEDKIEAIYEYMVQNFSYDYDKMETVNDEENKDKAYVPSVDDTYASKTGICYDLSSLTAAMLRSVSVPAKVVTGYSKNTIAYHAWNSIFFVTKDGWKTVDVTYDIQCYQKGQNYSIIKKDEYYSNVMYMY